jgi:hypothetical protein
LDSSSSRLWIFTPLDGFGSAGRQSGRRDAHMRVSFLWPLDGIHSYQDRGWR